MNCLDCGTELVGKRVDARFCNDSCKKRWQRKQKPARPRGRPSGKREAPSSTSQTKPPQGADAPTEHIQFKDCMKKDIKFLVEKVVPAMPKVMDLLKDGLQPFPHNMGDSPSLAQSVLSRLSTRLPSSAPKIPRGTPIIKPKKK